jgi:hypothetical protein
MIAGRIANDDAPLFFLTSFFLKCNSAPKKRGAAESPRLNLPVFLHQVLVMSVVIVPVVFHPPRMSFHVPPLVVLLPAILASLGQFMARVFGLLAVVAVMFDRVVQVMVGSFGAVLAFRLTRAHARRASEEQKPDQCRKRYEKFPVFQHPDTPFILHPRLL